MCRLYGAAAIALLGSVTVAGGVSAADLIADPRIAIAEPAADQGSFYLEIYGGGHFAGESTFGPSTYDMDAGPSFGAAAGMLSPVAGLAFELDAMWTSSAYSDFPGYTNQTVSLMVNADYTIALNDAFDVYGAVGLGGVQITWTPPGGTGSSGWGAGYQLAAGARAHVTDNVALFGELKYQDTFGLVGIDNGGDLQRPMLSALSGLRFEF